MKIRNSIPIELDHLEKGLILYIDEQKEATLFSVTDAVDNNEAETQILEGFYYDYQFNKSEYSFGEHPVVQTHSRNKSLGTITPNTFVGTLNLPVLFNNRKVGVVELEVQSIKVGYRDDYRVMLEYITEKCTELLMYSSSPISQYFETDYLKNNTALYQKFAFVNSIISSDDFWEAVHRVIAFPNTRWKETKEEKNINKIKKIGSETIKQFSKGKKRTNLPVNHYLNISYGLNSLPDRIPLIKKIESLDTPENRFVKHVLSTLYKFCSDINKISQGNTRLEKESFLVMNKLEEVLHHSFFKEISEPQSLSLNSPLLQKKEGYREVLRVWLMFDLAAKLSWKGGDDIYEGGKKDIAVLYEYWLFFKLLDLIQSIFGLEQKSISDLIQLTNNGLDLQIKQGNHIALSGIYSLGNRHLRIRYSYNRSFGGKKEFPSPGSWTITMIPDYTLSFWPIELDEKTAEKEESIVHIHFDAKYKIANFISYIDSGSDDEDEIKNKEGIYKNSDLLKMHAYKDAIRRTAGAYVLYPGHKSIVRRGFHEILPGLGAFPVRPVKGDDGTSELKKFILEVVEHLSHHGSQRERLAKKVHQIFSNINIT